jgi:nicotinate phosphoribosyltransferase
MSEWLEAEAAGSALMVDLYELTMMQAYHRYAMDGQATFDLFVRRLPPERRFLLVAGVQRVLDLLESLQFTAEDIEYLDATGLFDGAFVERLESLRFSGDVAAVPEGTVVFANEPILRVTAPMLEAQLLETLVMNQVHLQTLLASKAARVVLAAQGRTVVDFGLRRMHGAEAGLWGARAFFIAGVAATSNVLAGRRFDVPIAGTMAHSFVQAHTEETEALRRFLEVYPSTVLLVDTYDTLRAIDRVVELVQSMSEVRPRGVRLDSGDLEALSRQVRERLDGAGLADLQIFASGNLDELRVRDLLRSGAPIDAFGVGTRMGTSEDDPNLDIVYKLAQLGDRPVLKLSADKSTLPAIKQVWRQLDSDGRLAIDVIGLNDEERDGEPLLVDMVRGGVRLEAGREALPAVQERAKRQLGLLPEACLALDPEPVEPPVRVSRRLLQLRDEVAERYRSA